MNASAVLEPKTDHVPKSNVHELEIVKYQSR